MTVVKCTICERPISHNPKDKGKLCRRCEKSGLTPEDEWKIQDNKPNNPPQGS